MNKASTSHIWYTIMLPMVAGLLFSGAQMIFFLALPDIAHARDELPMTEMIRKKAVPLYLTPAEKQYLKNRPFLAMVCDPAWPPFDYIDASGKHAGMAADYLQLISFRIGIPIKLIPTESWEESMRIAKAGECDLVSILNSTINREAFLEFTDPYLTTQYVIIGKGEEWLESSLDKFGERTIAVVQGYMMEENLRRKYPGIHVVLARTTEESLFMVDRGEAFATVTTAIEATHFIRKNKLVELRTIGQMPYKNKPSLGVRRADLILYSIMQKAVQSLTEAEKRMILAKWVAGAEESESNSMQWIIGGALALILLVINFLYRTNKRRE